MSHAPSRPAYRERNGATNGIAPNEHDVERDNLQKRITTAAFAFRGYDASNLGRSPELLEHHVYGPIVRTMLDRASVLCGDVLGEKVDLAARVLAREPSTLSTFVHDIGTIVAMELAQLQLLEKFFDVPVHQALMSFGHSIGELVRRGAGGRVRVGAVAAGPTFPRERLRGAHRRYDDRDPLNAWSGARARGGAKALFLDQQSRTWDGRAIDVSVAVPGALAGPRRHAGTVRAARCKAIFPPT